MSKPNWSEAPSYANYLAMDKNGCWYWYENRPKLSLSTDRWLDSGGTYDLVDDPEDPDYRQTLEARP